MQYIVQTLPYEVFKEADKINKLFEMGLDLLHIRKPLYSKKDLKKLISEIDETYHSRIVLHSHFSLLGSFKLKGIHIELSSLDNVFKSFYYQYLKKVYKASISVTTNKLLKNKLNNDLVDYVFLGPLFVKFSEESIVQKFNAFELKKELNTMDKKVFAIGCVNLKNIFTASSIGFNGSVLQAYIWKSEDVINAFKTVKLNALPENNTKREVAI